MSLEARLDSTRLPIPENNIPFAVSATNPFPIRGEPNLTSVTCNGVTCEPFLPNLPEVVSAVYKNLIVKGLCSEIFICGRGLN
jgi:hypothetical protein